MAYMTGNAIIPICTHIKDDGVRCGSPALRGRALCYHHDLVYRGHRIARNAGCNLIPAIKSHRDIRAAVTNVLRAERDGLFTAEEVATMLWGFQIARSLLPKPPRKRSRNHHSS
jgi:hypothetical protein